MSKRAGAISADTKARILQAAENEFAERGFEGAALRRISAAAGVTTGAVYFLFDGKEDLFQAVISSITVPFMEFMKGHYAAERSFLRKTPQDNENADYEISQRLIDFYFQSQQSWDILLHHQSHPCVQAFLDTLMDETTDHYMYLLGLAQQAYPEKAAVDRFAVHQFAHMQTDTMLTLISHNFSREQMLLHSKTVVKMLRGAFHALLSG